MLPLSHQLENHCNDMPRWSRTGAKIQFAQAALHGSRLGADDAVPIPRHLNPVLQCQLQCRQIQTFGSIPQALCRASHACPSS